MSHLVRLPILVYHSIDDFRTSISTSPSAFRSQMTWLADHGWTSLPLSDAVARILAGSPIPKRSFVLTFDDGMQSIRDLAAPILRDRHFTATVFVITGQVGQRPDWYRLPDPSRVTPLLSVDQLKSLASLGWEMMPHTHDHPVLTHLPRALQSTQIARSRELVAKWFGSPADILAYPFGQFNHETRAAMAECEMRAAVTLRFSMRIRQEDPFAIPRVGSAWLKDSPFRQRLALTGWLERYVRTKARFVPSRDRHFTTPTRETTRGLLENPSPTDPAR